MATVGDILSVLTRIAPPQLAYPDDPIGLQVGRKSDVVTGCVLSLDPSLKAIEFASSNGFNMLITHHPLIYHPLRSLAGDSAQVQAIRRAVQANLSICAAHTNWDAANGGVNDTLATVLELSLVSKFGEYGDSCDFKLIAYVPPSNVNEVVDALAELGCGQIGLYRRCASFVESEGTFEPQAGAEPHTGAVGKREVVEEMRVEMVVPLELRSQAEAVLRKVHPYEEPAYDFISRSNAKPQIGRMGQLKTPITAQNLSSEIASKLHTQVRTFGKSDALLKRLAVIGGAGGHYWLDAKRAGADALLTGEVRHHEALGATESGFCLFEGGHYATEQPGMAALARRFQAECPDQTFVLFEPDAGSAGRPFFGSD